MKKFFMSMRLLTVKDNSRKDLRTSHAQFLEKGSQRGRKTSKIKFCHKKRTLPAEKVKIIEIIFLFYLPAGCECTETPNCTAYLGMNEDN